MDGAVTTQYIWPDPLVDGKMAQSAAIRVQLGLIAVALSVLGGKRHDYSPGRDPYANFRGSLTLGVHPARGALVRLMDKVVRVNGLIDNGLAGEVRGESVIDNLADVLNYAAIAMGLICEMDPALALRLEDESENLGPILLGLEDTVMHLAAKED